MSQTLLAKLDALQEKVNALTLSLDKARTEAQKNKELIANLTRENEQLQYKVEEAQTQVSAMLNQWFPELELDTEKKVGNA